MEASAQRLGHEPDVDATGAVLVQDESAQQVSQRHDSLFRRALAVADMLAVAVAVLVSTVALGHSALQPAALFAPLAFVALAKALRLYERDSNVLHHTTLDEIPALFSAATVSALCFWLSGRVLATSFIEREQVLACWLLLFVLLVVLRSLARTLAGSLASVERCLFIGDAQEARELREKLAHTPSARAELSGWIQVPGSRASNGDNRAELRRRIDAAVQEQGVHRLILGPGAARADELPDWIRTVGSSGVKVSVMPDVARVVTSTAELDRLHGITLIGMRRSEMTFSSRLIKRAVDVVGALSALVAASPVMAAAAIAIKLDSPGPVIFRQLRAGRHGEPFEMLKFRSMVAGADDQKDALRHLNEADGIFKIRDDPRITTIGRLLRRLHIDELPQLLNVLRGEMSLVGPRPLPLDEDASLVGWHRRRLDVRPGMTGVWQALGSSRIAVREMVKLDYQYVAHWSLWNDARILLLTARRILSRQGQ